MYRKTYESDSNGNNNNTAAKSVSAITIEKSRVQSLKAMKALKRVFFCVRAETGTVIKRLLPCHLLSFSHTAQHLLVGLKGSKQTPAKQWSERERASLLSFGVGWLNLTSVLFTAAGNTSFSNGIRIYVRYYSTLYARTLTLFHSIIGFARMAIKDV